jgi:hypothetical protein
MGEVADPLQTFGDFRGLLLSDYRVALTSRFPANQVDDVKNQTLRSIDFQASSASTTTRSRFNERSTKNPYITPSKALNLDLTPRCARTSHSTQRKKIISLSLNDCPVSEDTFASIDNFNSTVVDRVRRHESKFSGKQLKDYCSFRRDWDGRYNDDK